MDYFESMLLSSLVCKTLINHIFWRKGAIVLEHLFTIKYVYGLCEKYLVIFAHIRSTKTTVFKSCNNWIQNQFKFLKMLNFQELSYFGDICCCCFFEQNLNFVDNVFGAFNEYFGDFMVLGV